MTSITKTNLHKVTKSFQPSKSPGPDRKMIEFFLGFRDMLENDLIGNKQRIQRGR